MEKDRIIYLIKRIRTRTATAEEELELKRIWDASSNDTRLFDMLSADEKEMIRQTMFHRIRTRIDELEHAKLRRRWLGLPSSTLRIAASISVIAVFSFFVYWFNHGNKVIVSSDYGELVTVTLPDKSEVMLNGNSSLRYAETWGDGDDREVWLEGEAFFDVTHTTLGERFVVHTSENMDVQVLGTRFNVKERRGIAQVMLEEGKVKLTVNQFTVKESMTLKPGELATLLDSQLSKERVDPKTFSSWKDSKLIFDETPLYEVASMLEDTYGYDVVFEDGAIGKRKLSGEIHSRSGSDIVSAIRASFGIKISDNGRNRIIIHSSADVSE